MTADSRRFRTGGGILWNIIKAREPKAYKEIMRKAKEFEVLELPCFYFGLFSNLSHLVIRISTLDAYVY